MKKAKTRIAAVFTLAVLCMALCALALMTACSAKNGIEVTFVVDTEIVTTVEENGKVTPPEVKVGEDEVFYGWSTTENADVAQIKGNGEITYAVLKAIATDGKVKLYPVVRKYMTISVTIVGYNGETKTTVINNSDYNTAELPNLRAPEIREELVGWATTENATSAEIEYAAALNFFTLETYAVDGALTLYPVYVQYDLYVSVWAENGSSVYVSAEQMTEIQTGFETYWAENNDGAVISVKINAVSGKTAAYAAKIPEGTMVIISGTNIATEAQCLSLLTEVASYQKIAVAKQIGSSQRYLGLVKGYEEDEYALAFIGYMSDDSVTVTFAGETSSTVVTYLGKETAVPAEGTVNPPEGQRLIGWATRENADEPEIGSGVTYSSVVSLAVNGAVTLYPVYGNYDLVVGLYYRYIVNDGNLAIIKNAFDSYLAGNNMSIKIDYRAYEGNISAEELGTLVSGDGDVDIIVGCGNNIDSSTGANLEVLAKSIRLDAYLFDGIDKGQWAALLTTNQYAVDLYALLTGAENQSVEVTIKADANDEGTVSVVHGIYGGTVNTDNVTPPSGKIICGWATTENSSESQIESFTYDGLKALSTDGKVTLYPVYASMDLLVAVWGQNGDNVYATQEEIDAMEAAFKTYLGDRADGLVMSFVLVTGKTADYPSAIPSGTMVIISGKNIESQCGTVAPYACVVVKNVTFTSARYAGLAAGYADNELAIEFIKFLCDDTIAVTFNGGGTYSLSLLEGNVATAPEVTAGEGKTFIGWATTADATAAQINAGVAINYNAVSALATDGAVTLYPVIVDDDNVVAYDLVVAYWTSTSSTVYFSHEKITEHIVGYCAQLGATVTASDITSVTQSGYTLLTVEITVNSVK